MMLMLRLRRRWGRVEGEPRRSVVSLWCVQVVGWRFQGIYHGVWWIESLISCPGGHKKRALPTKHHQDDMFVGPPRMSSLLLNV